LQSDQLVRECLDQIRGYDANFSALIGERYPFRVVRLDLRERAGFGGWSILNRFYSQTGASST
jgi:hypothetical protein